MNKKIKLHYPMGSGGHWLRAVLEHSEFEQAQYINFHYDSPMHWVFLSHSPDDHDVALSGPYHFNFFCNQIYKHLHHERDFFNHADYADIVLRLTAMSAGIKKFSLQVPEPYFDFEQLINCPVDFLHKIQQLQQHNNRPVAELSYFQRARTLFIESCVDCSQHYNNTDSAWWNLYCLGQLICMNTVPDFVVSDQNNYTQIKLFVQTHYNLIQIPPYCTATGSVTLDKITALSLTG